MNPIEAPLWLKIWLAVGGLSFILCLIPNFLRWPKILIPASIFFSSVLAALVYGVSNQ